MGEAPDRAASGATGRGLVLLAIALVIGILLLNKVDSAEQVVAGDQTEIGDDDDGAAAADSTTTTSVGPTSTTKPLAAPRDIIVLVANASGVNKAGAKVKDQLAPSGYNLLSPATAKTNVPASVVHFQPDFQREAEQLATVLALPKEAVKPMPNPVPVADLKAAKLLVLVGPDLANRAPAAPAGGTSTTAKAGTATTARPGGATTTTTVRGATTTTARTGSSTTSTTKKP